MAATVEGTFRILDRASRPLDSIRRHAVAMDAALEKAGRSMDRTFGQQRIRQIETTERAMRNLTRTQQQMNRTTRDTDVNVNRTANGMRKLSNEVGIAERGFRKLLIITGGIGRALMAFKIPALIAGVGLLIQSVGALAGAVAALVPQLVGAIGSISTLIPMLGRLGGVAAALPATFTGLALAMGTVKLAFKDLGEAMGGNEEALKRLTPAAREFMETLKRYKPVLDTFRRSAQEGGLFSGLTVAVERLQRGVPIVNSLIRSMSATLGQAARQASARLTQRSFLMDMLTLGRQGTRIVGGGVDILLNMADALRHVAVAARPFTDWMLRTVVGWSRFIAGAARAGRETGRLAGFFRRSQAALTTFGHILRDVFFSLRNIGQAMGGTGNRMWQGIERAARTFREMTGSVEGQARMRLWFERAADSAARMWRIVVNLGRTLVGIGRASRMLGDSLWESFDRAADRWAEWVNSVGGQIRLTMWFESTRDAVYEIVGLFTDLMRAIANLSTDPALAPLIAQLRDTVPILERIVRTITQAFGPPLIAALEQIARFLENLAGASGPLTTVLDGFAKILKVINDMIDRFPVLGSVIGAVLTVLGINIFIGRVVQLARSWWGVATAARAAGAAQAVAGGGGGGGFFGGLFGGGRGGRGGGRGGLSAATLATRGMGPAASAGRGAGFLGRAGVLGTGALRGAGRFAWPIALGLGAMDMAFAPREGNFGAQAAQTISAGLSGATFGIIPRVQTGTEQMNARERLLLEGGMAPGPSRLSQLGGALSGGFGALRGGRGGGGQPAGPRRVMSLPAQLQQRLGEFGGARPTTRAQVVGQIGVVEAQLARVRTMQSESARVYQMQLENQVASLKDVNTQLLQQEATQKRIRIEQGVRASNVRAHRLLGQLGARFDVTAGRAGKGAAMDETRQLMLRQLDTLKPEGQRILANNVLAWAREAAQKNPQLVDEYQRMVTGVTKKFETMKGDIKVINGQVVTGTDQEWGRLSRAISGHAEAGKANVTAAFAAIRETARRTLMAMGFSGSEAGNLVALAERGKSTSNLEGIYQGGGLEGMAGSPRAATGANGKKDGPSRYIGTGTGTGPSGGGGTNLISVGRALQAMGYQVGEHPAFGGVHPVHTKNSWHYKGMALDINWPGGGAGEMQALDRIHPMLARLSPTELIWRSAGHFDHLHLAMGGPGSWISGMGGGGGTGMVPALSAPNMGGGYMGVIGQAAANAYAGGLTQSLNNAVFGGWFARGGDFIAHRPTVIGVGENGSERVTVTPRGRGGGGGGVRIGQIIVQNHRAGDIQRQIEVEVSAAFNNLSDSLSTQPMVGDAEVLA